MIYTNTKYISQISTNIHQTFKIQGLQFLLNLTQEHFPSVESCNQKKYIISQMDKTPNN